MLLFLRAIFLCNILERTSTVYYSTLIVFRKTERLEVYLGKDFYNLLAIRWLFFINNGNIIYIINNHKQYNSTLYNTAV